MKPATYIRITDKVISVSWEQKPVYPSANAEMASNGRCWDNTLLTLFFALVADEIVKLS